MIENSTPATMNLLLFSPTFFLILFLHSPTAHSQGGDIFDLSFYSCYNYVPLTTAISKNIQTLLLKLISTATQTGFAATSSGDGQDRVYGLAQCRGDVSAVDCNSCLKKSAKEIQNFCPGQSYARMWYDYCFMRYNARKFFGEVDLSGGYYYPDQNMSDPAVFKKKLGVLMEKISAEAAEGGGVGKGRRKIDGFTRVYGLVQCTGDLSEMSCRKCLASAVGSFAEFCGDKRGCRVLYGSCCVRYEVYPFFFPLEKQEMVDFRVHMHERVVGVKH